MGGRPHPWECLRTAIAIRIKLLIQEFMRDDHAGDKQPYGHQPDNNAHDGSDRLIHKEFFRLDEAAVRAGPRFRRDDHSPCQ